MGAEPRAGNIETLRGAAGLKGMDLLREPRRRLTLALAAGALTLGLLAASPAALRAQDSGATVSGTVIQPDGASLPGMLVEAQPLGAAGCSATTGCVSTYSGSGGTYSLPGLAAGSYELTVLDAARTVSVTELTVTAGETADAITLRLGPPSVPPGTDARDAALDLRRLNAERARDDLPAGVVLNPRWSAECAAHDEYEAANGVLQSAEDPSADDASPGGAWAGLNGDLAEGHWTAAGTPWENAPIHLLALLAPSLSVTGIDDSGSLQCAVTFPGMLRRWTSPDTVSTVPAAGARRVAGSELARETPFTPVQFVGLPASRTTGRELFVYLNRSGQLGQSPVSIVRATLRGAGHSLAVRWVDSTTKTLGAYLAGGIVIPLRPLRPGTLYRASVTVRDGAGTLTRTWSFSTRPVASRQALTPRTG